MGKARFDLEKQTPEQKAARERMGLLPSGKGSEVIFVEEDKWVVSPFAFFASLSLSLSLLRLSLSLSLSLVRSVNF